MRQCSKTSKQLYNFLVYVLFKNEWGYLEHVVSDRWQLLGQSDHLTSLDEDPIHNRELSDLVWEP